MEGGTYSGLGGGGTYLPRSGGTYLPGGGGYLLSGLDGRVPTQVWVGGYLLRSGWGYLPWEGGGGTYLGRYPLPRIGTPPPRVGTPPPHQNSIACACYAVGGMPLAFTQENFLVSIRR